MTYNRSGYGNVAQGTNIYSYYPQQTTAAGTTTTSGGGGSTGGSTTSGGSSSSNNRFLESIVASAQADSAAQLVYSEWLMRTGDERLALEKAQQAWTEKYQSASLLGELDGKPTLAKLQQEFAQKMGEAQLAIEQAGLTGTYQGQQTLQAIEREFQQRATEAGLLGTYGGQQTQAAQQQQWAQGFAEQGLGLQREQLGLQAQGQAQEGALGLLGLQSQLQGPRDWTRYWQLAASAPQGLTSALSSLAGRYQYAPGFQGTPGAATLGSRTQDLLSGGQQGTGGAAGTGGAQDGQAGNAWQWNLQNWQRMSPSMQQGVLGAAEAGGAYGPDLERLLQQAAPRYTMGGGGTQIAP